MKRLSLLIIMGLSLPMWAQEGGVHHPGRLFFLDLRGRVLTAAPDGSDMKVLVDGLTTAPDGIVVDDEAGHIYWSNMGQASRDDGSVQRADLDGRNVRFIVPPGGTFTAKQLQLDKRNRKLYWSDREGMRVQRVNLDGSGLETIVVIATGDVARRDAVNWCVGIALDVDGGKVYWTQKGGDNEGRGRIARASLVMPKGQTAATRTDVEVLADRLPEPIDLELDLRGKMIYWTDRGDAPRGNTVNRMPMTLPAGASPSSRKDHEILAGGFNETIGISRDEISGRLFVSDLRGTLYGLQPGSPDKTVLLSGQGTLTGVAYVPAR